MNLALLCDYFEERWPSMDRAAAGLSSGLRTITSPFKTSVLRPKFVPSFGRLFSSAFPNLRNLDRGVNRYLRYPTFLGPKRNQFDVFHVVDHSYAHLCRKLPPGKYGVFVHDIDAFRATLPAERKQYPLKNQLLSKYLLSSLMEAPLLFTSTSETAKILRSVSGFEKSNIFVSPYGCDPQFFNEYKHPQLIRHPSYLLHVGSCIPRKRMEWLLEIFARVHNQNPGLELIQVGGTWTTPQKVLIETFGLKGKVHQFSHVSNEDLAGWYRHAKALLLPSSYEGFGFPILEALASGSALFASDLPTTRELGGTAVTYCKPGNIEEWSEKVIQFLQGNANFPRLPERIAHAKKFTWEKHARIISEAYEALLDRKSSHQKKVA